METIGRMKGLFVDGIPINTRYPPSARGGHATPVIESDAMAKKTKNAPKGQSRSQKLSVKKQPIKDLAPKQGKDVKGGAFLRIRRFD